ncbi:uncharacterized protein A4U43_C07F3630 [Asparagus officinalis]|uniref:Uncharacterized protein n=1 Tax=Asparagus officinalis TaxID=4686 RepID=A0A5P1E944_ASPOF|nr:uncharacterized protein A4U43_C07F3630 [Asparagus officinalis]
MEYLTVSWDLEIAGENKAFESCFYRHPISFISLFLFLLGLLAFHLALVNQPQEAIVISTFASVLYLGTWDRGIKFVRENVKRHVQFVPEIEEASGTKSDESLLEQTSQLASLLKTSVSALVDPEALQESLVKYKTTLPSSNLDHLIFVPERAARNVLRVFDGLESDIHCYAKERSSFCINYDLLKRGDPDETRFVLGKVIFDTLNSERALQEDQNPGTHKSNGEVIRQNNQNTSIYASKDEPVHWKNQNARRRKNREPLMPTYKVNAVVDEFKGERIHQRNSNTNTEKGKKGRSLSTLFE